MINWLTEWLSLFPAEIESGGESIRTKEKYVVNKFTKFCKDNPTYTKDTIFAATKMYLNERKEEGYKFTKRATYFISKQGEGSLLATYCDKVINNQKPRTESDIPTYEPINDYI